MHDQIGRYIGPTGDSALVRFLYPAPAERRPGAILKWWERRRVPFNLIVGVCGGTTLSTAALLSAGPAGLLQVWQPLLVCAILANVCYSLGAGVEIAVNSLWGRRVLPVGPTLFRQGVIFSVGLTLVLPTILGTLFAIARILGAIF